MGENGIEIFFIGVVVSMLILSVGFIFFTGFLFQYKRRTMRHQQEKEIAYFKALADAEHEIKEETLIGLGRELHDNIGQILTVAKIQLNEVQEIWPNTGLDQVEETLLKAVDELRTLSRSLNTERVKEAGLLKVLDSEIGRIDALTRMSANISYEGEVYKLKGDREVIVYRILQEFISNTLKHSGGTELNLDLYYSDDGLKIEIADNGHGFEIKGSNLASRNGFFNMRTRAEMIGAEYDLRSELNVGTQLEMFIKKEI